MESVEPEAELKAKQVPRTRRKSREELLFSGAMASEQVAQAHQELAKLIDWETAPQLATACEEMPPPARLSSAPSHAHRAAEREASKHRVKVSRKSKTGGAREHEKLNFRVGGRVAGRA